MPRQTRSRKIELSGSLAPGQRRISFLDFTADLVSGELFRKGEIVALQERPFQVLALLLRRPNEPVSRREICKAVWKRYSAQTEASLNTAIRKLRAALGDDARDASIIKTVGRNGYKLVVQTEAAASPDEVRKARILVKPFEESSRGASDRFAEWITEQMIVQLADPKSELRVVVPVERKLRSDAEPRADYVLSGSVNRANGKVRVNAALSRAEDGTRVWSGTYLGNNEDMFRAQDEITLQIACDILSLIPKSSRTKRETTIEVHGKTEKGQYFAERWNEPSFERAVTFFEQAIAEDPEFAPARAALARTHASMLHYGVRTPAENRQRILTEAGRALELSPNLPEALVAVGCAQFFCDADWKGAEQSFQHALNVDPGSAYAYEVYARLLLCAGRHEESINAATRARGLDPLSPYAHTVNGSALYFGRRYEEAMTPLLECIEMEPSFSMARAMLARCYESLGRFEEAVRAYRSALDRTPKNAVMMANLAHGLAVAGEKDEARELANRVMRIRQETYVPGYWIAMCHLGLGEVSAALEWLQIAIDEHCGWRLLAGVDPKLDSLRDDLKFKRLLKDIGFELGDRNS